MQRYKIIHRTYYNYSNRVTLGKHLLRLYPRESHELRIESFILKTSPDVKIFWSTDVEGNSVAIANFDQQTQQLSIESEVILEQFNEHPLDFIVSDYAVTYPFVYEVYDQVSLSAYMILPQEEIRVALLDWLKSIYTVGTTIETYTLLQKITQYIYSSFTYNVREEEGVQTPQETLSLGTGSCRDFASLLMETLRCLGLASRFVSGYLYDPLLINEVGSTHAWTEVYIPGVGWKGFDPTSGTIVGSYHIPVAVARVAESVPPIAGLYSGNAESDMSVGVWISQY